MTGRFANRLVLNAKTTIFPGLSFYPFSILKNLSLFSNLLVRSQIQLRRPRLGQRAPAAWNTLISSRGADPVVSSETSVEEPFK